jgi:hypothetical protein
MYKNKNDKRGLQSGDRPNQPSLGKDKEVILGHPGNPVPKKPTTPVVPDKNPDPTFPGPGGNEPAKNDPTRIEDPSKNDHPKT